jgi:sec-independent protein translocase protein TatA
MPSIGPMELIIVLVIALLVLGPKRLPEAGRSVGEALRGFKRSVAGIDAGEDRPAADPAAAEPAAADATHQPAA